MLNNKQKEQGQSLVELLVAMGVFVLFASAVSFLVIDSYIAHRAGKEETIAVFLAQEGLEAARSIRDSNWLDLVDGEYGIAVSGGQWVFQGSENDVSDKLRNGRRKVIVSSVDPDRKRVEAQVLWDFSLTRSRMINLITYLTNWQKSSLFVFFEESSYSVDEDAEVLFADVYLSATSDIPVSVDYRTIDQTAVSGDDYIASTGTLVFLPGDIIETINVIIIDDLEEEDNETFLIELYNPVNAELGDFSSTTVTIVDNDGGGGGGCWGTGGSCDPECLYSNYGTLTDYYTDPGCSDSCSPAGSFYVNPSGSCSSDGSGTCYKMENPTTQYVSCVRRDSCQEECNGTCTPCERLSFWQCFQQRGCRLSERWPLICTGRCWPCNRFTEPDSCGPEETDPQYGCSWEDTAWWWRVGGSTSGYSSFISCEWYSW